MSAPLATQPSTQLAAQVAAQVSARALAAAVEATRTGLHTITVQLRPAELGAIQVVATMGAAGLSLNLHAASDVTRELLRSALADLRVTWGSRASARPRSTCPTRPPTRHRSSSRARPPAAGERSGRPAVAAGGSDRLGPVERATPAPTGRGPPHRRRPATRVDVTL